ncbi:hypothetical protein TMES_00430 [Thalassospira mesophila]|uniref:Iron dicitrate transport regulator FecR n=1 Tax=Thalassospira mesophila TaxID=1293891 RepID=A0A1Y2L6X2_9PROT|nr:hypothetical protein TMES_00430 [Thalassospira mesophila]
MAKNQHGSSALEQAIYWFALLLDGTESEHDRENFACWIASDPAHHRAFLEIEHLWTGTSSLNLAHQNLGAHNKTGRRAFLGAGLAAVLVGAAGWYGDVLPHHPFADFRTVKGTRRKITVMDGVQAELASQSSLSLVTDDRGASGVALHEGEVFFAHDGRRRDFFVSTASGIVRPVAAAQFDVTCYDGQSEIITQTGSVDVETDQSTRNVTGGNGISCDNGVLGTPYEVDLAMRLAWRKGRLVFVGDPLEKVANVLQRWHPGRIIVLGDALKQRPVTLVVNLNRTSDVLPLVGKVLSIEVDQIGDYLTILRDA